MVTAPTRREVVRDMVTAGLSERRGLAVVLLRPQQRNEVWSADFVFDRTAEGRVLKCLTIVDDATSEAVAVVPARALGGLPVTRVLDQLAISRGLPLPGGTVSVPRPTSRPTLADAGRSVLMIVSRWN